MPSNHAVGIMLVAFSRTFTSFGDAVDPETVRLYAHTLRLLSDQDILDAMEVLMASHQDRTIPLPAQIISAARTARGGSDAVVAREWETALRAIEKMAVYSAHVGMQYPRVEQILTVLGPLIADAAGAAGGAGALFSDEEVARSIARREFRKRLVELAAAEERAGRAVTALVSAPVAAPLRLPSTVRIIADGQAGAS